MTSLRGDSVTSTTFSAIGTTIDVLCTDTRDTARAIELVQARLDELDRAASRFRPDSELAAINSRSAELVRTDPSARLRIPVSTTLGQCLQAAARTERLTAGLVSASLGTALIACGYDDDLDTVRTRTADTPSNLATATGPAHTPVLGGTRRRLSPVASAGRCWRLGFDGVRWQVGLLAGTAFDLGASAKAWAADAIAAELAASGGGGFLVNLGGDIAVAGPVPDAGWVVGVRDWNDAVAQSVCSTGQAFATSSTMVRTWVHNGVRCHHIIDPRTSRPASSRWGQVTCAAPDAVQANAASTAAVILDDRAPRWLARRGVPARLVTVDGRVVTTGGWPAEPRQVS